MSECVHVNDESSMNITFSYGVAQGSVLGPILFKICSLRQNRKETLL